MRVLKAKPYSPQSKGGVEVFNRFANAFLAEASVQKIKTLEELNQFWDVWLEEYYHNKPHEGIEEYYKSFRSPVPAGGISHFQEWNRDSHPLAFLDAGVVGKAFLHREVDKGGCISVNGRMYETSTSLIGAKVKISYDPLKPEIIMVSYDVIKPFLAKPLQINEYCVPKPEIPVSMLPVKPEFSRFLEGLKRRREHSLQMQANVLSFSSYGKEMQIMYEAFFEMDHTPFTRDVPPELLYEYPYNADAIGSLTYAADRQTFAVVTADAGCGKSTLIRRFVDSLPKGRDIFLYLSDSKLIPRWFYKGLIDQLGIESKFYRGDAKRQLQNQIEIIRGVQNKKVICILDETHLLEKETIEEIRFLLNYRFDSMSPMALVLVV